MPATLGDVFSFPQANEQLLISYCLYRGALKATPGEGESKVALYQREYLMEKDALIQSVSDLGGRATVMGIRGTGYRRSPWDISWRTVPAPGAE